MGVLTRLRGPGTINARVLRIALIPSIALMVVGIGLSGYLALQGLNTLTFAENVRKSLAPSTRFIATVQQERRLSTLKVLGKFEPANGALVAQREKVDDVVQDMRAVTAELAESAPEELAGSLRQLEAVTAQLPQFRRQVDAGTADAEQVYDFYNEMVEIVGTGIQGVARSANDAEVGFEQMISYDLFRSVSAQSRTHVLLLRHIAQGLNLEEFHEAAHQMGTYHEIVETIYSRMTPTEQQKYDVMGESRWWETATGGDDAMMSRGPGLHPVTFDLQAWQNGVAKVQRQLLQMYSSHSAYAANLAASSGSSLLTTSLIAGGTLLLVTGAAVVFALRRSRELAARLIGLRNDTLELAGHKMPELIDRLNRGERIDINVDVPWIDHGSDEIGEVADAFNQAQRHTIAATVRENEIRAGVRAVFLNIAHRNQVTAHRQLQVLDKAERSQEDPEQLQLLFELDHLATQGRRNAESLIILGGKQPGRQWRKPVELRDVLDGAVAETAQYTKVNISSVADVALRGDAVADMIHLLAELLDNATSFSPPQTDVDVRSAIVGRGVVIEIEDQGLGMEPEQLEQIDAMLRTPPDFSVMALSEGTRIGLFVVAQLAARHDVKVTLRESMYGGINAVVLIPSRSLADADGEPAPPDTGTDAPPSADPATVAGSGYDPGYDRGLVPMPTPLHRRRRAAHRQEPDDEAADHETAATPPAEPEPDGNGHPGNGHSPSDTLQFSVITTTTPDNGSASQHAPQDPAFAPQPAGNGETKPPLPKRRRRESLAPQLQADQETPAEPEPDQPPDADPPGPERFDPSPERFQASMSAFQRGTRRARSDASDTPHPPRWPGEEETT